MQPTSTGQPEAERFRGESGAAVAEMALVAPFLLFLVFGIIEFSWAFGQHLDVRHGARETGRLIAVNYRTNSASTGNTQTSEIIAAGCDRMDLATSADIGLTFKSTTSNQKVAGQFAIVTVEKDLQQITGLFAPILDGIELESTVETRLEQTATWNATASPQACP